MKVFVDTNILVDFVCNRLPFSEDAKRLFAHGYVGDCQLQTSALSVVNAVYIGNKYKHEDVKGYLKNISTFVEVVDLRGKAVVDALFSDWKDYEDATQNETAVNAGADCIVTRNKKDFKDASLSVYTTTELFARMES